MRAKGLYPEQEEGIHIEQKEQLFAFFEPYAARGRPPLWCQEAWE